MILSHSHKFIFVHCRKVAGSSMKLKLAPLLGLDDLIIGSVDEIMRAGVPLTQAMNDALQRPVARLYYWSARAKGVPAARAKNAALKRVFREELGSNPPHPTALSLAAFAGHNWNSYTKFCFTRNPYERVVSDYFWRQRASGKAFSFSQYLDMLQSGDNRQGIVHADAIQNWDMMTINDNMQMDYVGRYEKLQVDFEDIMRRIGLGRIVLDKNSKKFDKIFNYSELYKSRERKIVYKIFEKEIEYFKYTFPY